MKRIYLITPFDGRNKNGKKEIKNYCNSLIRSGMLPISPYLYCGKYLDLSTLDDRELMDDLEIEMMLDSDEAWVIGCDTTKSMECQVMNAISLDLPVRFFNTQLQEIGAGFGTEGIRISSRMKDLIRFEEECRCEED